MSESDHSLFLAVMVELEPVSRADQNGSLFGNPRLNGSVYTRQPLPPASVVFINVLNIPQKLRSLIFEAPEGTAATGRDGKRRPTKS